LQRSCGRIKCLSSKLSSVINRPIDISKAVGILHLTQHRPLSPNESIPAKLTDSVRDQVSDIVIADFRFVALGRRGDEGASPVPSNCPSLELVNVPSPRALNIAGELLAVGYFRRSARGLVFEFGGIAAVVDGCPKSRENCEHCGESRPELGRGVEFHIVRAQGPKSTPFRCGMRYTGADRLVLTLCSSVCSRRPMHRASGVQMRFYLLLQTTLPTLTLAILDTGEPHKAYSEFQSGACCNCSWSCAASTTPRRFSSYKREATTCCQHGAHLQTCVWLSV